MVNSDNSIASSDSSNLSSSSVSGSSPALEGTLQGRSVVDCSELCNLGGKRAGVLSEIWVYSKMGQWKAERAFRNYSNNALQC